MSRRLKRGGSLFLLKGTRPLSDVTRGKEGTESYIGRLGLCRGKRTDEGEKYQGGLSSKAFRTKKGQVEPGEGVTKEKCIRQLLGIKEGLESEPFGREGLTEGSTSTRMDSR